MTGEFDWMDDDTDPVRAPVADAHKYIRYTVDIHPPRYVPRCSCGWCSVMSHGTEADAVAEWKATHMREVRQKAVHAAATAAIVSDPAPVPASEPDADVLRQVWANVFAYHWTHGGEMDLCVARADEAVADARRELTGREVLR